MEVNVTKKNQEIAAEMIVNHFNLLLNNNNSDYRIKIITKEQFAEEIEIEYRKVINNLILNS